MKETKTLNVASDLHREVKVYAMLAGVPLGEFVNAVIRVGLAHPDELTRLLEGDTNSASLPEKE